MSSYPVNIRRCQHIKVNGTQCKSPALRREKFCYFHTRWHGSVKFRNALRKREFSGLPILEDANSIQVGLAEVMLHLVTKEIDTRTGALMLYALQTASANLRMTSFEPEPTQVVIDQKCVKQRPLGTSAWSKLAGREYDDLTDKIEEAEQQYSNLSGTMKSFLLHKLGLPPDTFQRLGVNPESDPQEEEQFVGS